MLFLIMLIVNWLVCLLSVVFSMVVFFDFGEFIRFSVWILLFLNVVWLMFVWILFLVKIFFNMLIVCLVIVVILVVLF